MCLTRQGSMSVRQQKPFKNVRYLTTSPDIIGILMKSPEINTTEILTTFTEAKLKNSAKISIKNCIISLAV